MGSSRKTLLTIFWLGFIINTLTYVFSITPLGLHVNILLIQSIQLFGILLLFPAAFILFEFNYKNNYLRILFPIYFLWQVLIVFRGISLDFETLKTILFDSNLGILIYFTPLFIFFPKHPSSLNSIFKVTIILGVLYLIFDWIFIEELLYPYGENRVSQTLVEVLSRFLSISAGFVLLTFNYHPPRRRLFALFLILLTLIFAAIRARRSLMFTSSSILLLFSIMYYISNKGKPLTILISMFVFTLFLIIGAYYYQSQSGGVFGYLNNRLQEDTRSGVINNYYTSMATTDWIIGRGINGDYYCPGINEGHRISTYRTVIENGFLQLILKGGLINLILMLMISLPAIYKGLFQSKNILSKAASLWILWFFINLYGAIGNVFNLNYMLVWISIGICFDSNIRSLTDSEIMEELI